MIYDLFRQKAAEDRMFWLYEDMKDLPEYKKWLY